MLRKITTAIFVLIIVFQSVACSKGGNNGTVGNREETPTATPTPAKKASGFRMYERSMSGTINDQFLKGEYEDLITERTYKTYSSDGEILELKQWYYDDTGEHLLKMVEWEAAGNTPSRTYEYDLKGRLVCFTEKFEGKHTRFDGGLDLPKEYYACAEKEYIYARDDMVETLEPDISELRTEYAYREDTGELVSIKSYADEEQVCSLELGEGDIILSEKLRGRRGSSYEETYNPETRKGTWSAREDDSRGERYVREFTGEKEYDESGRCTRNVTYVNINGEESLIEDTVIVYDEEGALATTNIPNGTPGSLVGIPYDVTLYVMKTVSRYDHNGRQMKTEEYVIYDGEMVPYAAETCTRNADGSVASITREVYNFDQMKMCVVEEETYNDVGELICQRSYDPDNGALCYDKTISYTSDPEVAGTVRLEVENGYVSPYREESMREEEYQVCMRDEFGNDLWVTYLFSGPVGERKYGTFDAEGHMIRYEDGYWDIKEFDTQGRILLKHASDSEGIMRKYIYEYWEGTKPE
ncbi:MAG: hypothetical protein J5649_00540 [Lachnospiraceae bacterium]|nr:hypothetical protein [Lachnospiraceae bacterium]